MDDGHGGDGGEVMMMITGMMTRRRGRRTRRTSKWGSDARGRPDPSVNNLAPWVPHFCSKPLQPEDSCDLSGSTLLAVLDALLKSVSLSIPGYCRAPTTPS